MNKEGGGYQDPYVKLWKAMKAVTRLSGSVGALQLVLG